MFFTRRAFQRRPVASLSRYSKPRKGPLPLFVHGFHSKDGDESRIEHSNGLEQSTDPAELLPKAEPSELPSTDSAEPLPQAEPSDLLSTDSAEPLPQAEPSDLLSTDSAEPLPQAEPFEPSESPSTNFSQPLPKADPKSESQKAPTSWESLFEGIDQGPPPPRRQPRFLKKQPLFGQFDGVEFKEDERQNFKKLLDNLLDRPTKRLYPKPNSELSPPAVSRSGMSAIERQLMDLMEVQTPIYKKKPLPNPIIPTMFSRFTQPFDNSKQRKKRYDESNEFLWRKPTSSHPRIQEKDMEYKEVNRLLECQSNFELRKFVIGAIFKNPTPTSLSSSPFTTATDLPPSPWPLVSTLPSYYASLIATAISHALALDDPYMALAIFEQTKRRGIESYVAGCTTQAYNAVLRARWDYWRDVRGMEGLVEEMMVNGVGFDEDTERVVIDVGLQMEGGGEAVLVAEWTEEQRMACNRMRQMVGKWLTK